MMLISDLLIKNVFSTRFLALDYIKIMGFNDPDQLIRARSDGAKRA
ncbi:hypothetical protein EAM_1113 [Erwinia amylovora ATCC 49946]|nr:hypothetical protein EAM_1113 [Erwinia amylovora ATCC 49946]